MSNTYDLPKWEHPSDYGGFSPDGDFLVYSRTRDSDCLDNSNYECILADLEKLAETFPEPPENDTDSGEEGWVYDFRASHWAVGWVETILVRKDAPEAIQKAVYETLGALSDYPVYNETHFSELEWSEASDYWASMDVSDRVDLCRDNGCSIFAARSDCIPADDDGSLYESLTCNH